MVYFSKKLTYLASVLALVALGTGCEITVTTDFDSDGVEDGVDDCPGTRFGDVVDSFGCSLDDDDGDGVLNDMDNCVTPAGDTVGADGCSVAPTAGTLDGMWLINGVAASATTCADAGIVEVRFTADLADGSDGTSWTFSCGDQNFDSRVDVTHPTIEFNTAYMSFWEALDASGAVVAMTEPLALQLNNPPQHATVATPDFIVAVANELTIPLSWETDMSSGVFDTCAGAEVDGNGTTIMLYLSGEGAPFASFADMACADSLTFHEDDFPTLAPGTYELDVTATSTDGTKWGNPAGCVVEYGGGAQIAPICNINVVP